MEISQFSKLMVVPFMAYQLDKKMFQCILLNLVVPSINSTDDPPPDFLISPYARGTRRSPFSTRRKLRMGGRRRSADGSRCHGEESIRRVSNIRHTANTFSPCIIRGTRRNKGHKRRRPEFTAAGSTSPCASRVTHGEY